VVGVQLTESPYFWAILEIAGDGDVSL
jgi:hypothetical protein